MTATDKSTTWVPRSTSGERRRCSKRILTQHGIFQIDGEVLTIVIQPKLDARQPSPRVDDEGRPTTFDPEHVVTRVPELLNATADDR